MAAAQAHTQDLAQSSAAMKNSNSNPLIQTREPGYSEVFYSTTNGQYTGHWHDGTRGTQVSRDVPRISDVLGARPTIKKPVRPLVTTAKCMLANAIEEERKERLADKVLSADVVPKKFPVKASDFEYPESGKRGSNNPLYQTSSQAYGKETPMPHQIADRYFPSGNKFTQGFVDKKPRYTGLSTAPTYSHVHKALDEYF